MALNPTPLSHPPIPTSISVSPIILAQDLGKTYRAGKLDVAALRKVSFSVDPGEFVAIVGPSGSGKSTLFYILGGLTQATSGSVLIDGTDFAKLSDGERNEILQSRASYYPNDLAVIGWNAAFLYDSEAGDEWNEA